MNVPCKGVKESESICLDMPKSANFASQSFVSKIFLFKKIKINFNKKLRFKVLLWFNVSMNGVNFMQITQTVYNIFNQF